MDDWITRDLTNARKAFEEWLGHDEKENLILADSVSVRHYKKHPIADGWLEISQTYLGRDFFQGLYDKQNNVWYPIRTASADLKPAGIPTVPDWILEKELLAQIKDLHPYRKVEICKNGLKEHLEKIRNGFSITPEQYCDSLDPSSFIYHPDDFKRALISRDAFIAGKEREYSKKLDYNASLCEVLHQDEKAKKYFKKNQDNHVKDVLRFVRNYRGSHISINGKVYEKEELLKEESYPILVKATDISPVSIQEEQSENEIVI